MGISDKVVNITLKANVINLQQVGALEKEINKAVAATGKVGPASNTAAAGLTKIQGAAVSGNKAINQFGVGTDQATSKLGKFGKVFSDNRGIVFGVAGLTSALAEAVGMMGMFSDTQLRLTEAQDELNRLEEEGITTGKAHADAVAEVTKQQRFFNMVSRNTILSQMDMVFFTTMVISGLVKMNTEGGAASGMLGKLKGTFTGLKSALMTTTNNFGSFMNAFSPLPATMTQVQKSSAGVSTGINQIGTTSAMSMTKVLAFSAAIAGIGLAAAGMTLLLTKAEELKNGLNEAFAESLVKINVFSAGILQMKVAIGIASEEEKRMLEEVKKGMELTDQAMKNLNITSTDLFMGGPELTKKLVDEIVRLGQEGNNTATVLSEKFQEPITALEAFNTVQTETRETIAAVIPFATKFTDIIDRQGISAQDAKDKVKPWVDLLVDGKVVSQQLGDAIEQHLLETFDDMIKAEADATKETEKMIDVLKGLPTVGERVTGFMSAFSKGSAEHAGWMNEITIAVDEWKKKNAENIPMLDRVGQTTAVLTQDLTDHFKQYMNLESAQMMAAIGAALFGSEQKNVAKETKDLNKDLFDQADILSDLLDEYNEVSREANKFMNVQGLTQSQMERIIKLYDDQIGGIHAQAEAIRDNAEMWGRLTQEEVSKIKEDLRLINSTARTNDMLAENEQWLLKLQLAYSDGLVGAKEWTEQTILASVESEAFRENLLGLNDVLFKEMDTFNMLTSELQEYATFAMGGRDATIELARASEEARDSMVESFSSLFDAEKFKDFKKEFKELDLRKVFGKDGAGDFKDMFADMRESAQDIEVLSTAMRALGVAVQDVDRMSGKDLSQNFDSFAEAYKKTIVQAGLGNPVVDQMIERWEKLSGTELRQELDQIPQTWMMINEAIKTNGISNMEANAIDIMRKKETGEINKLTQDQIKILNDAGFTYDETTGKITATTDAINHYNSEMSKVEVTGIAVQTISKMWAGLAEAIMNANLVLVENWSTTLIEVDKMFVNMIIEMIKQWTLITDFIISKNEETASHWSKMCNSFMKNASAAGNGIRSNLEKALDDVKKKMSDLASHWSKMCNSMIANAKSAAKGIQKAMDSIKDTESVHTIRTVRVGQSKGGIWSMEEGGMVSAASGLFTTNGPANLGPFHFGDNSGGRETVAFIPHDGNKADNIMDQLDRMFGRNKTTTIIGGGGERDIIVPITLNINGEQYSWTQRYRLRQGQEIASQVI